MSEAYDIALMPLPPDGRTLVSKDYPGSRTAVRWDTHHAFFGGATITGRVFAHARPSGVEAAKLSMEFRRSRMPDGGPRYISRASGIRWTFVNGRPIISDGRRPEPAAVSGGRVIRAG
jgi:hypothetical protein